MSFKFRAPESWNIAKLSDVVVILDSKRVPINSGERTQRILNKSDDELFPYYGATGQVGVIDDYLFDEELILLGEDGAPFLEKLKNKAYLINGKSWVNNHAHVLRVKKGVINSLFLNHYLNIFDYRNFVTGTTRYKLNQARMRNIPIPLPPMSVQLSIVAKIQELFSKLDMGLKSLFTTKNKLQLYKKSTLQSAFTGRLSEKWRLENEDKIECLRSKSKDITDSSIKSEKGRFFESVFSISYPESWGIFPIGALCKEIIGGGTPSRTKPEYFSGNIPWITPTEIPKHLVETIFDSNERISEEAIHRSSARLVPKGAVLLTSRASIGYVAIAGRNLTTNQGFASFVCSNNLHNTYLAYWLWANKDLLEKEAGGTTFKEISKSKLRTLSIPVPTLAEQEFLASKIRNSLLYFSNLEKEVNSSIQKINVFKQSILASAFVGKLSPNGLKDAISKEFTEQVQLDGENKFTSIERRQSRLF